MRYFWMCVIALVLGSGCAADGAKRGSSAPADEATLSRLRDDFSRTSVRASVAAVSEVLADKPFLAASVRDTGGFPVGSAVTVADTNMNTLAHGRVVAHVGSDIHASFVVTGSRSPKPGDVIVHFP